MFKMFWKNYFHFDNSTDVFWLKFKILSALGLSPWVDGKYNKYYKYYKIFSMTMLFFFFFFIFVDFYNHLVSSNFDRFMESFSKYMVHFMGAYKFIILIKYRKYFEEIINFVNAKEFQIDDQDAFNLRKKRFVKTLRVISVLFLFGILTLFSFLSKSPMTLSQESYVIENGKTLLYWLMLVHSCVATTIGSSMTLAVTYIFFCLIGFVSVEYRILGNSFNKVLNEIHERMKVEEVEVVVKKLKEHAKYYERLCEIGANLQRIFIITMMFEMVLLTTATSLCLFEVVKLDDYYSSQFSAYSNLMICVINETFVFSFLGELIQHESQIISDRIYDSNWYKFDSATSNLKTRREFKALIILTMIRARKQVKITAGGLITMNYETFVNVMKFCYTVVTILIRAKK